MLNTVGPRLSADQRPGLNWVTLAVRALVLEFL